MLAVNITLILKDLLSLENSPKTFKLFQHCSGLKLNIDKTKDKHIGKIINPDHFPHGLSWIKIPLETLGIFINNDAEENLNLNFKPRIVNLTNLLNVWKQRYLSLKGQITIINTLALAPLIYLSITIDTPDKAIAQVNYRIQNFLWDGKTSKIAQTTLIQSIEHGGLKLCHLETKTKALKLVWIKRLIHLAEASWKV